MGIESDWSTWLAALRARLSGSGERRLLCLCGTARWSRARVDAALGLVAPDRVLWVGEGPADQARVVEPRDATRVIGGEFEWVVYDARAGFCPDGFGAVAGTLRGDGLLLLMLPALDDWPAFNDPQRAHYASWPATAADVGRRYLARLARVLVEHPGALVIREDAELPALPSVAAPEAPRHALPADCLTPDQGDAVAAVQRVAEGHPKRPLLLVADRGRGKSAALGIAAARLLNERPSLRVLVTAPRRFATATLFEHAACRYRSNTEAGADDLDQRLRFVDAPELTAVAAPGDLVLVDEAAGLPVARLAELVRHCHRIAFATTMHGYEGAGRGFALRFSRLLEKIRPQRRIQRLDEPIRWRNGDPLEALINAALLLDAEPPALGDGSPAASEPVIERVGRDALAADEALLRATVGLLVGAHYQTRPRDLRLLLDAPANALWLARHEGRVLGAVWVAVEGGFDAALTEQIRAGERRPRGNLLPQTLVFHLDTPEAGPLRYARVQRIVVHPDARRRGLGHRLLAEITGWAAGSRLDFVGTSFGVAPDLLAFWRAAGFDTVRLGDRADPASGARSALMLSALQPDAELLLGRLRRGFLDALPTALCDANRLRDLEPELVAALLAGGTAVAPGADERRQLQDFRAGRRPLGTALPALRRAMLVRLAASGGDSGLSQDDLVLAVRVLLQGQAIEIVAKNLGLAGRAAAIERLRQLPDA